MWPVTGYANGDEFIPDRFAADRHDTWNAHSKSWMVFGCGNHSCVGQRYATHHLICFLAVLATTVTWERTTNPKSNEVDYLPTLYPHDCVLRFAPLQ